MSDGRAHSRLGASSAAMWLACPGSIAACRGLPDISSPYAIEGTAAHSLIELCISTGRTTAAPFIGTRLRDFGTTGPAGEVPVTKEMVSAVDVYLEHFAEIHERADWHKIEHRFSLADVHPDLFGTCDAVLYTADDATLHVLDYKHGKGKAVSGTDNVQLKYYALGALMHPELGAQRIDRVTTSIVQPRTLGDAIKPAEFDPLEIYAFAGVLAEGARRTEDPNAPRVAGPHCQFCKAKPTCETFRAEAEAAAIADLEPVGGRLANVATLTPEQIGERFRRLPILKAWIKALETHALSEALAGRPPPGLKLVHGRSIRKWGEDPETAAGMLSAAGIPDDDLWERKLVSPAEAEKLIGKKAFASFSWLVSKPPGKIQLAPADDPRPAADIHGLAGLTATELLAPETEE